MALFDAVVSNGGAPDASDAGALIPLKRRLFDSGAPVIPPSAAVDPSSIAAPDVDAPSIAGTPISALPWMRSMTPAQPPKPARINPITGNPYPTTKLGWLTTLLTSGFQGALAGRGAEEQTIAESGGRRSGGIGTGFVAGVNAVPQQQATIQRLQAGRMQNQMTQMQINQTNALNNAYRAGVTTDPSTGQIAFDRNKVIQTLGQSGSGAAIPGLLQSFAQMDELQGKIQKQRDEHASATNDYIGAALQSIVNSKDPQSGQYDMGTAGATLAHIAQLYPQEAEQLRRAIVANPSKLNQIVDSAIAASPAQQKLANERTSAQGAAARGQAALGELSLNQTKVGLSDEVLTAKAQQGDADAKAILDYRQQQTTGTAAKKAGAEAAAKFPWEARLEQMRQQGDPVFAYDPKSKQTIQVSRAEAQQGGYTNIVKVGQSEIDKAKTSAMQLGDATMNIQAYKQASQRMDELSGSDIATVSRVLGSDQFKAHFLGMELPVDWANELYRTKGWTDMPESAKDAVVNYLAARPAAISLLRAINPGVRLTESQIATELKNIPDPTTPSDIRDRQFARLDRNIDQASKTLVKVPGVDLPSEIRDRLASQAGAEQATRAGIAEREAAQTGQYRNAKGNKMQVGQEAYDTSRRYIGTVSKVYGDGSYDVKPD